MLIVVLLSMQLFEQTIDWISADNVLLHETGQMTSSTAAIEEQSNLE